jgi:CubicO group peptidase (beta-lactamase class C family)
VSESPGNPYSRIRLVNTKGGSFFASEPLVAPPGTHFNYSTQGYTVVGCAIEGASAKKYADSVRERVLVPAGMSQTRPDDRLAVVPSRTRFYSKDRSGTIVNAEFLDSSYKVPGGGWLSSAPDMARFAVAVLNERLVIRLDGVRSWMADGVGGRVKDVGHGGWQQGTSAALLIAPDSRSAIIVLTNSDSNGAGGLATKLLRILMGIPAPERKELGSDSKLSLNYVGTYRLMDFTLAVVRDSDRLFVEADGRKTQLFPESTGAYAFGTTESEVTFVTDSSGRAKELVLHEGGADLYLARVK